MQVSTVLSFLAAAVTAVQADSFSAEEQAIWINRINYFRTTGLPWSAGDMRRIGWSSDLATTAASTASGCSATTSAGVNVFQSTSANSSDIIDAAIQQWVVETSMTTLKTLVQPGAVGVDVGTGVYNSYSQVLWAATTSVGCATASCSAGDTVVCEFSPAGNDGSSAWYVHAESASDCSSGTTASAGLCIVEGDAANDPIAAIPAGELTYEVYPAYVADMQTVLIEAARAIADGSTTNSTASSTGSTTAPTAATAAPSATTATPTSTTAAPTASSSESSTISSKTSSTDSDTSATKTGKATSSSLDTSSSSDASISTKSGKTTASSDTSSSSASSTSTKTAKKTSDSSSSKSSTSTTTSKTTTSSDSSSHSSTKQSSQTTTSSSDDSSAPGTVKASSDNGSTFTNQATSTTSGSSTEQTSSSTTEQTSSTTTSPSTASTESTTASSGASASINNQSGTSTGSGISAAGMAGMIVLAVVGIAAFGVVMSYKRNQKRQREIMRDGGIRII